MAARDNLSPDQFGPEFDPVNADYSGTAYQYGRGSRQKTSGAMATIRGEHFAADVSMRIPTGATADFQPSLLRPGKSGKATVEKFVPNFAQLEPN